MSVSLLPLASRVCALQLQQGLCVLRRVVLLSTDAGSIQTLHHHPWLYPCRVVSRKKFSSFGTRSSHNDNRSQPIVPPTRRNNRPSELPTSKAHFTHTAAVRNPHASSGSQSRKTLYAAATPVALLAVASFAELSRPRDDEDNKEVTGEQRMLAASQQEREELEAITATSGLQRILQQTYRFIVDYVGEPVCIGLRFLQLALIFVPVIVSIPILWLGRRDPERDDERRGALWWYGFLVWSMERAGPAFIKLGQWAASRSDIFPMEMCDTMSRLHSNAPSHPLRQTKRIIERAFGGHHFDDIFVDFEEEPLGVGAIAQVYKAKLNPELASSPVPSSSASTTPSASLVDAVREWGTQVRRNVDTVLKVSPNHIPSNYVAVKVLHPGVEVIVRRDLRIMKFFARLLDAIPSMEWLSLPGEVNQFGEMMNLQLDFRIEAANLVRFRENFADRSTVSFPFPYVDLTTRHVLVEEFAQGIPLADFLEKGGGVFQKDISSEGLDAFLRMLLLDNFVHADLHPGNIMVRFYQSATLNLPLPHTSQPTRKPISHPSVTDDGISSELEDVTQQVLSRLQPYRDAHDAEGWELELEALDREGYRPQLIFIDTGLVTELNATNRRNFLDLFRAVAAFDGYKAGHLMCERCRQPEAVLDAESFAKTMGDLVMSVKSRTLALGNVKIGDILQQVLTMVRQHHVRLEGDFVNVVISILLLEGIGRSLDPDLDLLSQSLPILRQLSAQSGASMASKGDFSMLLLWVGLETRRFLQASIEDVERCVKYDLLSPNIHVLATSPSLSIVS